MLPYVFQMHIVSIPYTHSAQCIEYSEPIRVYSFKQLFAISIYMSCDFAHSMVIM